MGIIRQQVSSGERVYICDNTFGNSMLKMLEHQIEFKSIHPEEYVQVVIEHYPNGHWGDDLFSGNYPIRFYSKDGMKELWISGLGNVCVGEMVHDAVNAMQMMGFEIFQKERENIHKAFSSGRIISIFKMH